MQPPVLMYFRKWDPSGSCRSSEVGIVGSPGEAHERYMDYMFGPLENRRVLPGPGGSSRVYFREEFCLDKYVSVHNLVSGDTLMNGYSSKFTIDTPEIQALEVITMKPEPGQIAVALKLIGGGHKYTILVNTIPVIQQKINERLGTILKWNGAPLIPSKDLAKTQAAILNIVDGFHARDPELATLPSAERVFHTSPEVVIRMLLVRG